MNHNGNYNNYNSSPAIDYKSNNLYDSNNYSGYNNNARFLNNK